MQIQKIRPIHGFNEIPPNSRFTTKCLLLTPPLHLSLEVIRYYDDDGDDGEDGDDDNDTELLMMTMIMIYGDDDNGDDAGNANDDKTSPSS